MSFNKIKLFFFKMIRIPIQSSSGFAIMEVMIAVALLALLSYGVMELLSVQQKGTLSARIVSSRDLIATKLARYVGDPRALQATANFTGSSPHLANTAFAFCINGGGSNCIDDGTPRPVTLLDSNGVIVAGGATPIIYDETGSICPGVVVATAVCPLVATTTFTADCGGAVSPCPRARWVTVTFTLQKPVGLKLRAGGELRPASGDASSGVPLWASNNAGNIDYLAKWATSTELATSVVYEDPVNGGIGVGTGPVALTKAMSVSGDVSISGNMIAGDLPTADSILNSGYGVRRGSIVSSFGTGYTVGIGQNSVNEIGMGILRPPGNRMAGAFYYAPGPPGAAYVKSYYGDDIGFITTQPVWPGPGDAVRMVIKGTTGNVGIGTMTPASPLSVSGDLSIGDSAMTGLFRGIYATKNGTTVIGFDNPGVNDDLAVGMGQNTVFETGMAVSNRTVPLSSFFYSTSNNSTNIKAYRGRGIALVVENTAGSTAQQAISILNDDLPNRAFVGIGTNSPTERLHVNGNLLVNGSITSMVNLIAPNIIGNVTVNGNITATGTITAMSDARLKKNLTPIENSLKKILSLEGLYYNWKDKKRGEERQMGLIAQKVEAIFPEGVRTDEKGMKSINYNSLVAPLIEALREEVHKTKALEEKIKQLEQRLEKLESK